MLYMYFDPAAKMDTGRPITTQMSDGTHSADVPKTTHQSTFLCGLCLLQGNCLTLLFAAHDTVASTMALLLRFLKHNPEALQKLRAEQRQVIMLLLAPSPHC